MQFNELGCTESRAEKASKSKIQTNKHDDNLLEIQGSPGRAEMYIFLGSCRQLKAGAAPDMLNAHTV